MDKAFIINFLKSHKQELKTQFGLEKIGLFGSYARDEQTSQSDIDIAVEIRSDNKFRSFFALKHYLEDNLHKKVDLGIESTLKPIVRNYIAKDIIYV
ncbi:MAG: nucleotidyltransferase family protein [Campylobacterales bacterium]|nr:nucleotidyltransferase family protein [Campylobacterales bacterium]